MSKNVLWDEQTVGPDIEISGTANNADHIARWWQDVRLYAKAMYSLERIPIIGYDGDEDKFYLSSVSEAK